MSTMNTYAYTPSYFLIHDAPGKRGRSPLQQYLDEGCETFITNIHDLHEASIPLNENKIKQLHFMLDALIEAKQHLIT